MPRSCPKRRVRLNRGSHPSRVKGPGAALGSVQCGRAQSILQPLGLVCIVVGSVCEPAADWEIRNGLRACRARSRRDCRLRRLHRVDAGAGTGAQGRRARRQQHGRLGRRACPVLPSATAAASEGPRPRRRRRQCRHRRRHDRRHAGAPGWRGARRHPQLCFCNPAPTTSAWGSPPSARPTSPRSAAAWPARTSCWIDHRERVLDALPRSELSPTASTSRPPATPSSPSACCRRCWQPWATEATEREHAFRGSRGSARKGPRQATGGLHAKETQRWPPASRR